MGTGPGDEIKRVAVELSRVSESAKQEQALTALDRVNAARRSVQDSLLDILRDPSLDLVTRKARLHSVASDFAAVVAKSPELQLKSLIAKSHAAIESLTAADFSSMMSVDAAGNLVQFGQPAGKLSDLMVKIKLGNAALKQKGIREEHVLSISTPADPHVPLEVKILTREPRDVDADPLTPQRRAHEKVEPSDPSDDGSVLDIGVGTSDYARDVGGETGNVVKTEYGKSYADAAMSRRDLTWNQTAPHLDVDSVVVLGDALQTLPMMFADSSVKRVFINNINAHYAPGDARYRTLAIGLRRVMKTGGRVEVQWTTALETTGSKTQSRGHITGESLKQALLATSSMAPRKFSVDEQAKPVSSYPTSVEATRRRDGKATKTAPTSPVPEERWVFIFED